MVGLREGKEEEGNPTTLFRYPGITIQYSVQSIDIDSMVRPSSMDRLENIQSSQLFQQIESLKQPSELDAVLNSSQICKQLGIDGQSRRELQAQRTLFREQLGDLRDMLLEQVHCSLPSRRQRWPLCMCTCTCLPPVYQGHARCVKQLTTDPPAGSTSTGGASACQPAGQQGAGVESPAHHTSSFSVTSGAAGATCR